MATDPPGLLATGPNAEELNFLATLVGADGTARASWQRWQDRADLDTASPEIAQLLPALYSVLNRLGVEHPWVSRLRGVYRHAWSVNQLTLRDVRDLHVAFADAGLHVVTPRGVPVVAAHYGDLAARPVDCVDLLVRPPDLVAADRLLRMLGWTPRSPLPPLHLRALFGPVTYDRAGCRKILLHWRSLAAHCGEECETEIHTRSALRTVEGTTVRLLDPADQLVLACVHHRALDPGDRLLWAADALHMMGAAGPGYDWSAVWQRADRMGVGTSFAASMRRLSEIPGGLPGVAEFPTAAAPDLPGLSALLGDAPGRATPARAIRRAMARYRATALGAGARTSLTGFLRFTVGCYRYAWGVPLAGLPAEALRRLRKPVDAPASPS